jgi:hypothetical protein
MVSRLWVIDWGRKRRSLTGLTAVLGLDPQLQANADDGYILPWPSLRAFLASHLDTALTYRRADEFIEMVRAGDTSVADPILWWWRWIRLERSMPIRSLAAKPSSCRFFQHLENTCVGFNREGENRRA